MKFQEKFPLRGVQRSTTPLARYPFVVHCKKTLEILWKKYAIKAAYWLNTYLCVQYIISLSNSPEAHLSFDYVCSFCPTSLFENLMSEMKLEHILQMHHELFIAGNRLCIFCLQRPSSKRMNIIEHLKKCHRDDILVVNRIRQRSSEADRVPILHLYAYLYFCLHYT